MEPAAYVMLPQDSQDLDELEKEDVPSSYSQSWYRGYLHLATCFVLLLLAGVAGVLVGLSLPSNCQGPSVLQDMSPEGS